MSKMSRSERNKKSPKLNMRSFGENATSLETKETTSETQYQPFSTNTKAWGNISTPGTRIATPIILDIATSTEKMTQSRKKIPWIKDFTISFKVEDKF